ncbi:MAG TPA: 4-alpha-glucanotransferase [Gaiellales bacterium]
MNRAGALEALAAAEGVLRSYTETTGRRRRATPAALAAVLRALGHDVDESGRGAGESLRAAEAARAARLAEPVTVAWGRAQARIPVAARERAAWTLALADGGEVHGRADDGTVELPRLPYGCHVLHLEADGRTQEVTVLQAPRRAHAGPERSWGLFVPLYALPGPFGPGDFTRMRMLAEWTAGLGGDLVGSTPLNAAFLDEPFEPSPYLPVSRLHWNELYADPAATPEWAAAARTRDLPAPVQPPEGRLIDYRAAAAAKRRVLEALLASLDGARLDAFEGHLRTHPDLVSYAEFRARCERERAGWRDWSHPDTPAVGGVRMCHSQPGDAAAARYHAYAQWLCEEQLGRVGAGNAGPYLDMPLGVHPGGYDTWRFRELFAEGVSVGAPPDDFFRGGQDWGLAPLHPGRLREAGHAYPIACAAALCRHASAARIDHVMGLHRMFWVPHGLSATEGVYVRYPFEELYAVLCIESHRHGTRLVGEDMGTVPGGVRRTMAAHGLLRTYAVQAELGHGADPFDRVPSAAMVGMNTHDMPTFAGFWDSEGAADGRRDALRARLERRGHAVAAGPAALDACLLELAGSDARALLVTLEDMWWERERQNVPGTTTEHPNWRRLARYGVDELDTVPGLAARLRRIADARRSSR